MARALSILHRLIIPQLAAARDEKGSEFVPPVAGSRTRNVLNTHIK